MSYNFPKADLHLHLDGSFRLETIWRLCQEQNVTLPATTLEEYKEFIHRTANCGSVNGFLTMFDDPIKAMQDKDTLELLTYELIEDLVGLGVRYAEIRFAPQLHTQKGLTQSEATQAILNGRNKALEKYPSINIGIITCMMCVGEETANWDANAETVQVCNEFKNDGVVALDLAGAEGIVPLSNFGKLFEEARNLNLNIICHAGDSQGPETVRDAIDFGVTRIGHGHHIYDDKSLCEIARDKQIVLEICPTSNIQCQSQPSFKEHPAKKLFDMGIPVTINTDNMTFSGTNLDIEYDHCINDMGFTYNDLIDCNINSIKHSFASDEVKEPLLKELEEARQ